MIKLLWNTTQHQSDAFELKWGKYHLINSKEWIYFLLKDIKYISINKLDEISENDTLIIIDSGIHFKENLYKKIKKKTKNFFLFHLNDEHLDRRCEPIYKYFNHVWRTYCSPKFSKNINVTCIPPGYKSGFENKPNVNKKRKYDWCFFGTLHKSSRHDMHFHLSKIKPHFINITEKFADEKKSLNAEEMKKIFLVSNFTPCPSGFFHPESYRIYEALECGSIPIVESIYDYFDHFYKQNPFIKITKWIEAKNLINELKQEEILNKRKKCIKWWNEYKLQLKSSIFQKIGASIL